MKNVKDIDGKDYVIYVKDMDDEVVELKGTTLNQSILDRVEEKRIK